MDEDDYGTSPDQPRHWREKIHLGLLGVLGFMGRAVFYFAAIYYASSLIPSIGDRPIASVTVKEAIAGLVFVPLTLFLVAQFFRGFLDLEWLPAWGGIFALSPLFLMFLWGVMDYLAKPRGLLKMPDVPEPLVLPITFLLVAGMYAGLLAPDEKSKTKPPRVPPHLQELASWFLWAIGLSLIGLFLWATGASLGLLPAVNI